MKASFRKLKSKLVHYRNYKRFCNEIYRNEQSSIGVAEFSKQNFEENSLEKFLEVCNKVLDKHAPRKSKLVRGSHSSFMNRELWKAIITRTRLRNKFFKEKTLENRKNNTKQQNYCVALLRKVKKKYYGSLDKKHVTDNKTFWKTVKLFFQTKRLILQKWRWLKRMRS